MRGDLQWVIMRLAVAALAATIGCASFARTEVGPAPPTITRGPGWVMQSPTVHLVFWGIWGRAEALACESEWTLLLGPGHAFDRLSEYGVGAVRLGTTSSGANYYVSDDVDDAAAATELTAEMGTGAVAAPETNTVYVVLLPAGVKTKSMRDDPSRAGYHGSATFGGTRFAYAFVQYTDADIILSHELAEAVTDPENDGWRDYVHTPGEIGDVCEGQLDVFAGYYVQKIWSVVQQRCI